jgi:hypothetical protein
MCCINDSTGKAEWLTGQSGNNCPDNRKRVGVLTEQACNNYNNPPPPPNPYFDACKAAGGTIKDGKPPYCMCGTIGYNIDTGAGGMTPGDFTEACKKDIAASTPNPYIDECKAAGGTIKDGKPPYCMCGAIGYNIDTGAGGMTPGDFTEACKKRYCGC